MCDSLGLLDHLDANRELLVHVTEADVLSMREWCEDDGDVVGAILGILYDAGVEIPEELLERCHIFYESYEVGSEERQEE